MSQAKLTIATVPELEQDNFADQLTTNFACGWRKLPDELKYEILGYNLVGEEPVGSLQYLDGKKDHDLVLHHHMALGPEIAALAQQVYYEKNTIMLSVKDDVTSKFKLPPFAVRGCVRKLVSPPLTVFLSDHWQVFRHLASGAYGFTGLQRITVRISLRGLIKDLETNSYPPTTRVRFHCRGQVKFTHRGTYHSANKRCIEKLFIFAE